MRPVPIDPAGVDGPTRGQAQGPGYRQTSAGLYVPASVDANVVEQRILEQAARIRTYGAITGWASLRWQGEPCPRGHSGEGHARIWLARATRREWLGENPN